jgi:hypothetical protein
MAETYPSAFSTSNNYLSSSASRSVVLSANAHHKWKQNRKENESASQVTEEQLPFETETPPAPLS